MTLVMEDLAIGYTRKRHPHRTVASGLNLTLEKGTFTCLLGPNGAGKSTLLKTLAGLIPPLSGQVRLEGKLLHQYARSELARSMSLVLTQRVAVDTLDVASLVAMGRHPYTDWTGRLNDKDHALVRSSLEAVGIVDLQWRFLGELSDGERQKAMIARALCQEPHLMIMDEPTAHLDLPRRVELMGMLRKLAVEKNCAILLSSHDLDLSLRNADAILLMDQGQVHTGIPEDLVLQGAFQKVFASQNLIFDPWSGAFHAPREHRSLVSLEGNDLICLWTERAMVRKGYKVVEAGASWRIQMTGSHPGRPQWRLQGDGVTNGSALSGEGLECLLFELDRLDEENTALQEKPVESGACHAH